MSSLHFLGLRSFPLTLSYCTSLRLLRSQTRLPLRRIRSLVYIFRVLVLYYLRTNITYFSLVSLWGSSERSDPPARLRPSCISSVLELVSPARVLVWTVNSCPPDSVFCSSLSLLLLPRYVRIRSDPNVTLPPFLMRLRSWPRLLGPDPRHL